MKINNKIILAILLIAVVIAGLYFYKTRTNPTDKTADIPLSVVKFGMLPYGDHSQAIIGYKQGWFKEVGIDLKYDLIKIEGVVPSLSSNRFDVVSTPPGILITSYDNSKDLCSFALADVFQGYALMAQPDGNYKSVDDFRKEGLSDAEAIKATVLQLKGKTFAFPSETAIKPFIDILLEKSGLKRTDFKSLVQDDPLNVNSMRSKQADFQVGGVPSRISLQKEGFKPLISSIDIVKAANPSPDSKELASVFQDGWAIKKDFYKNHKDIVLRMASVNFRINDFIVKSPDSALSLHMPYLSQITGEKFSVKDGEIIYSSLDPFFTFDAQKSWFHDPKDPLYYKNLYGSIINSFKDQKIFKDKAPEVDDVICADDVYMELEGLKSTTEKNLASIESGQLANSSSKLTKLNLAKHYYEIFDYYDSERLTKELLDKN